MYTSFFTTTLLAVSSLLPIASAIPFNQPLVRDTTCSWTSPPPCSCPSGTYFNQSSTTATIGASVAHVSDITYSFFNTSWFGAVPISTSGVDDTVSARRTYPFQAPDGSVVPFTEQIHSLTHDTTGGFTMEYYVENAPFSYKGGTFAGSWATLQIQSAGANETDIIWDIFSCYTGYNSAYNYIVSFCWLGKSF